MVIIVKNSDIIRQRTGNGGYTLRYFGNHKWYTGCIDSGELIEDVVTNFVTYLNSIPIKKKINLILTYWLGFFILRYIEIKEL